MLLQKKATTVVNVIYAIGIFVKTFYYNLILCKHHAIPLLSPHPSGNINWFVWRCSRCHDIIGILIDDTTNKHANTLRVDVDFYEIKC